MGRYPLSSGIVSNAKNLNAIISEVKEANILNVMEVNDNDKDGSMEIKEKRLFLIMSNIKILTCGSVDDGKSTLIGRIMHDTNNLYIDQSDYLIQLLESQNEEMDFLYC